MHLGYFGVESVAWTSSLRLMMMGSRRVRPPLSCSQAAMQEPRASDISTVSELHLEQGTMWFGMQCYTWTNRLTAGPHDDC